MIKSKVTGFIDFGSGPIEVQGEAASTLPPIDEALMERTRHFNESFKKMRQQKIDVVMSPIEKLCRTERLETALEHKPTGPIVEGTLAEKGPEDA